MATSGRGSRSIPSIPSIRSIPSTGHRGMPSGGNGKGKALGNAARLASTFWLLVVWFHHPLFLAGVEPRPKSGTALAPPRTKTPCSRQRGIFRPVPKAKAKVAASLGLLMALLHPLGLAFFATTTTLVATGGALAPSAACHLPRFCLRLTPKASLVLDDRFLQGEAMVRHEREQAKVAKPTPFPFDGSVRRPNQPQAECAPSS
jgi:hypothetical protein